MKIIKYFIISLTAGTIVLAFSSQAVFASSYSLYLSKNVNRTNIESSEGTEVLEFSFYYKNYGTETATNVSIVDDYDESKIEVYDAGSGDVSGGKITWNLGDLTPNSSGTINFKMKIRDDLPFGTSYIYNRGLIKSDQTTSQSNRVESLL